MQTIGFIGAGRIGRTVARLAVAAGHRVVLSGRRGPEHLTGLVNELGPRARAGTPADAARDGDILVVAVPLHATVDLPVEFMTDKVVIDTTNYFPDRDGSIPELDDATTTTSELLQSRLPRSRVVKAFNNIFFAHLAELPRPAGHPERSALAFAGDDADAKQAVAAVLDAIGYDPFDAGPLSQSWRFQQGTPAFCTPYFKDPDRRDPCRPVTAAQLSDALAAAVR